MPHSSPYHVSVHPPSDLAQLSTNKNIFALIRHGHGSYIDHSQPYTIQLGLPAIGEEKIEAWSTREIVTRGRHKQVCYLYSDTFLFGAIRLNEASYGTLTSSTIEAFQQVHDTLEETGFPALLRMWNFFPQINAESEGLERYRAFCLARHQAMEAWHFTEDILPAASAIGTHRDDLVIYFLAARQPGIQIENPRQVSAFHYPKKYGPKSPSFSRATLKNWGKSQHLYISGTASIVGHETKHPDDTLAQLQETLTNIRAVIDQANTLYDMPCADIGDLNVMRIYIRHAESAGMILQTLQQEIAGSGCQLIPVLGDICRSDLLLEIEGFYSGWP
jgi:chorismate lyase/3-hydroxybenzoate synthase